MLVRDRARAEVDCYAGPDAAREVAAKGAVALEELEAGDVACKIAGKAPVSERESRYLSRRYLDGELERVDEMGYLPLMILQNMQLIKKPLVLV